MALGVLFETSDTVVGATAAPTLQNIVVTINGQGVRTFDISNMSRASAWNASPSFAFDGPAFFHSPSKQYVAVCGGGDVRAWADDERRPIDQVETRKRVRFFA